MTDVAILGAGPAGLGAALRLARAGRSVVVLERAPVPGGLAASFDVGGVRVDHGSHRLHPSCAPAILDDLRGLLGDDLQTRRRHGRIRLAGRWVAFPPAPVDLVRHLPPGLALRLARDAATAPLRGGPQADTFAEVVRAGLGPTMLDVFYRPYVRKIWDRPPEELDGELARRRVGARRAGALLGRLLRPAERRRRGTFFYPRRGFGEIPEALAAGATAAGADVRLGVDVDAVRLTDDGVTLRAGPTTVTAAQVWSTVPLPVLARLAGAPSDVLAAADGLRYRALVLVYLVLRRDRYTEFDAHYFPELDVAASRVSEPKRYRESDDDPEHITVLCAEVPCSVGDATWTADDASLAARVADDLTRCGLPDATPVEVVVRRVPHAYPRYEPGFDVSLGALEAWAEQQPRLLTFGRQGLFAHDNTHHALATAWAAADALGADGLVDRVQWERARESFRAHVVED